MESTEIPSPHDPTPQSQEDLCHHGEENDTRQSLQIEETPPADETDAAYQRPDATNTRISFQEEEEKFIPLEETPSGYPELDWKPLVLQNWCLFLATAFFGACMTGLVIIVCLNNIAPEMLHVAQTSSRLAFRYVPAAAGTVTTVWWGSVARSYLRLIPYITMASASTGLSGRAPQGLLTLRSVSNLLAFFPTPAALARLIKERHILTMVTFSTSFLVIPFLTPLKNALFQTTQDPAGWSITVSNKVAYIAITVYSLLMGTTISILVRLWSVRTGLKWEASSIASQLALVQGSNIYEPFYGLEFEDPSHLYRIAGSWHVEYGVLRLGYWMVLRNGEETIWHGVRFYKPEGAITQMIINGRKMLIRSSVVEQPPTPRDEAETPTLEQRGTHEEGGSASPFLGDYNVTFSRNIDGQSTDLDK
ncbi:hypothetical protein PENSUB_2318 [Penicillium subrubescens]|uniref:Uncharacterized protein n=1 Tax=Penicillium subrubescens TaxID=1316194 RepID=A0A1Q5UI40_9EURO|nr:hypothetical protein PENSUB_2318 [Penicillium subrubescens]